MSKRGFEGSILRLLLRLWHHLSGRRRRQFILFLGLMLVSAFAEVVTLGAILPFLGVLIAPDAVFKHSAIANLARFWGIRSGHDLVFPLTVAFIVAALFAGAIRILLLWVNTRLAFSAGADLSIEIYRRTLYQPYRVHVARNTSEVISGITNKVSTVASGILLSVLTLISSAVLLAAITIVLIRIDPIVALLAMGGFGASYGFITWIYRMRVDVNGQRITRGQTQVVKALQEGLGGIRDVLLDGTQPVYSEIYSEADQSLRRALGGNFFIASFPRYAMEAIGMVMIAILAYGLSRQPGGVGKAMPVLAALALGAQRLLPALQQSYAAWTTIAGGKSTLVDTLTLLDQPLDPEIYIQASAPLPFETSLRFSEVSFRYTIDGPVILDRVSFEIQKRSRVGLVGSTGSGKSTLLDLLMLLLVPTQGKVLLDGESISGSRVRAWQRAIAHVPQAIFLADTTLAENIAFGVPRSQIDLERVRHAARHAQIADFIEGGPRGYNALVGERGVRLSGGQRQRIGIARALYKQASVLIFDEATSALDNATEQSVMDALDGLSRDLTIIFVAHRLTTVRRCDTIVELQHGRVVAKGTYDELLESSPTFRMMALKVG